VSECFSSGQLALTFIETKGVKMNQKQKTILLASAAIVALMALFPPYIVKNYKNVVIKSGYGFLFNLPPYISTTSNTVIPATVNASTLLVQIFSVLVVASLIYFAFHKN